MGWQVLVTDQYGSTSILTTVKDVESAVKFAKDVVTDENVNNALTVAEKERNWEHFFPQLFVKDNLSKSVVYAGKDNKGEHAFIKVAGDDSQLQPLSSVRGEVRFFLGLLDKEDWLAKNHKDEFITDINGDVLFNKAFYFLRKT